MRSSWTPSPGGYYNHHYGGRHGRRGKLGKLFRTAISVPIIRYQDMPKTTDGDPQVRTRQEYVNPAFEVGPEGNHVGTNSRGPTRLHSYQSSPAILQKSFLSVPDPENLYGEGGQREGDEDKSPASVSFSLPTTVTVTNETASGSNNLAVAPDSGRRKSSVADIAFNFAKAQGEPTLLDDLRAANLIGAGRSNASYDMGLGHFSKKGHRTFLHPFGNSQQDALEDALMGDIVKHSPGLNPEKFMVWVVFCGFMVGMAALIILAAELAGSSSTPETMDLNATTTATPWNTTGVYFM